jgi:hypothetical protein
MTQEISYTCTFRSFPSSADFKSEEIDIVYAIWEWKDEVINVIKLTTNPKYNRDAKVYYSDDGVVIWKGPYSCEEAHGSTAVCILNGKKKGFLVNVDESTHGKTEIATVIAFASMDKVNDYIQDKIQYFVDNRCYNCAHTTDENVLRQEVLDTLNEFITNKKVNFGDCMCDYVIDCSEMCIEN